MTHLPAHEVLALLARAFEAAVKQAQPNQVLTHYLPPPPPGRILVVGGGKAAAAMAAAVEAHYGTDRLSGLVITRYGHSVPTVSIEVVEAAHPIPDVAGLEATRRILHLLEGLSEVDLVLCLLSGGGSALLTAPEGVTLEQKAALTASLLRSGADIIEINTVRKHLSRVKGGWLAKAAFPANVLSLVISDVVGDDLSSIASGPTVPDPTTFQDALSVLDTYDLDVPPVRAHLELGKAGGVSETPKSICSVFARTRTQIVASAQGSLEAAARVLATAGFKPYILSDSVTGEAREVAKVHAAIAKQTLHAGQPFTTPCALLSGGETSVVVRGHGNGGRNSEFALSLAVELDGLKGVYALSADSDGIDGGEDNAGAFVTPDCFKSIGRREAAEYLSRNDSHGFFLRSDLLFRTGPTYTNVNDIRIILIGA